MASMLPLEAQGFSFAATDGPTVVVRPFRPTRANQTSRDARDATHDGSVHLPLRSTEAHWRVRRSPLMRPVRQP